MDLHSRTSTGEYSSPLQNGGNDGNSVLNITPLVPPRRGREMIRSPGGTRSEGSLEWGQERGPVVVDVGKESESHNRELYGNGGMRHGDYMVPQV